MTFLFIQDCVHVLFFVYSGPVIAVYYCILLFLVF